MASNEASNAASSTPSNAAPDHDILYESLDKERQEIRLLKLADPSIQPPTWEIETVSLKDKPAFTALSYVWGDPADTSPVMVNDTSIMVTKSLASALKHAPGHWLSQLPTRPPEDLRIWADRICINQRDDGERNHQVRLMRDIFSNAKLVLACIDDVDEDIADAMETLAILIEESSLLDEASFLSLEWVRKYPDLCGDPSVVDTVEIARGQISKWDRIGDLTRLQYWKRIWIFQETVLADRLLVVAGSLSVPFDAVSSLAHRMLHFREQADKAWPRPPFMNLREYINGFSSHVIDWTVISRIDHARERYRVHEGTGSGLFEAAAQFIVNASALASTDPKDHVYGLLGLTGLPIEPEYSSEKSVADVFSNQIRCLLDVYQRDCASRTMDELFFLRLGGVSLQGANTYQLPSWIPDFACLGSLLQSTHPRLLKPGPHYKADLFFRSRQHSTSVNGSALMVLGAVVDDIVICRASKQNDNMVPLIHSLSLHSRRYRTHMDQLKAFYSVVHQHSSLIEGPCTKTALAEMVCFLAFSNFISHGLFGRETFTAHTYIIEHFVPNLFPHTSSIDELLPDIESAAKLFDPNVLSTLSFFQSLPHNLRHFALVETASGYIGLAPIDTATGDSICVLNGSSYPVVLRRKDDHYILIGQCFVLGLMEGEAAEILDKEPDRIQHFNIL